VDVIFLGANLFSHVHHRKRCGAIADRAAVGLDQALNGTSAALEFSYILSPTVSMTLTAHEVYLPRPRAEIQGPQGIQVSFDWQAAYNAPAGQMCTVVLKNTIASY